jgi:cytochrome P450
LRARDDDGSTLSDEELRNHVVTFLLAGHETTASLMTWTLGLVATHPPIQAKIAEELRAASSDRVVRGDLETLALWPQLNASLQETLRLYPSIWIAERRVTTADHLGGFALPEGSSVIVSPYVTQRLPNLWPEPDEFRPQRFLDASPASGLLRGYFPFGAGPHTCIGQHFALMEAKIIVARLLDRFHFEPAEDLPPPVADITLRPSGPVRVRVSVRSSV